jgi:hypothetical protein
MLYYIYRVEGSGWMGWFKKLLGRDDIALDRRPSIYVHMLDVENGMDFNIEKVTLSKDTQENLDECSILIELKSVNVQNKFLCGILLGEGDYSLLNEDSRRVEYRIDDNDFDEGIADIMYEIWHKDFIVNVGVYEFNGKWFAHDTKLRPFRETKLLIRKQTENGKKIREIIAI